MIDVVRTVYVCNCACIHKDTHSRQQEHTLLTEIARVGVVMHNDSSAKERFCNSEWMRV